MQTVSQLAKHGTVISHRHGCRCLRCRSAWADYCRRARVRVKASTADFVVSAELAQQHLQRLSNYGVGLRAVAKHTGLSREHLQDIKHGLRRRIRQSTEEQIMRIGGDFRQKSLGSWMSAGGAERMVTKMLSAGWTKAQIARAMGMKSAALKWWGQERIRVNTFIRLESVFQQYKNAQKATRQESDEQIERMLRLVRKAA